MYKVTKNTIEIGTGTMTECIEFIATQIGQFHPEQVTAAVAVKAGYGISRV